MNENLLWIEKYRPSDFAEIKGQKSIIAKAKAFVEQKNTPHLLFAGPAGVGKTTLALVIAKTLFQDSWRENFLELNASDERGIDVVRVKVKDFARTKAIGDVPFKIIYLDECDALTKEAQQALRRIMENYAQTCRFILSCNYSSKIIDPIQSRCTIFKFKPLEQDEIIEIVERIAQKEGLKLDEDSKKALAEVSHGDCRRAENILQSCAAMGKEIKTKQVYEMASVAEPKDVIKIIEECSAGDFPKAKSTLLKVMLENGLSGLDMIKQIQKQVWQSHLDNETKLKMVKACGEIEFRMVEGSDEFVQLEALLATFSYLNSKKK